MLRPGLDRNLEPGHSGSTAVANTAKAKSEPGLKHEEVHPGTWEFNEANPGRVADLDHEASNRAVGKDRVSSSLGAPVA